MGRRLRGGTLAAVHKPGPPLPSMCAEAYREQQVSGLMCDHFNSLRDIDRPRTRFLSVSEAKRLLNAMPQDFRQLARGALYTGLRLGELLALTVSDFGDGQIHVRHSKGGKERTVPLSPEGIEFFDQVTAGKAGDILLFQQDSGERLAADPREPVHSSRRQGSEDFPAGNIS